MAAPDFDRNSPLFENTAVDAMLDQVRDNLVWLSIQAAATGYALPGWTTTIDPGDLDEPTYIELTLDGTSPAVKIRFNFTWTDGNLTTEVRQYDKGLGAGLETLAGGTLTYAYNGSDQLTGVTNA